MAVDEAGEDFVDHEATNDLEPHDDDDDDRVSLVSIPSLVFAVACEGDGDSRTRSLLMGQTTRCQTKPSAPRNQVLILGLLFRSILALFEVNGLGFLSFFIS